MNQHAPFLHPYDGMIPLSVAGYILGTVLLLAHLYALVKRHQVQAFLLASPRNHLLAQILLAGGLFWFFLLVAPEGLGVLSRFRVGLAEFEGIRWLLQLACPVFLVLMVTQVKNLLFPRALGIFGLMVAAPLLSAAFLQEPVTRLLIPIWCYIVIFLSILWIGKPYLYRDMVNKNMLQACLVDASLPGRNGLWSRHSALRHPVVVERPPLPARFITQKRHSAAGESLRQKQAYAGRIFPERPVFSSCCKNQ